MASRLNTLASASIEDMSDRALARALTRRFPALKVDHCSSRRRRSGAWVVSSQYVRLSGLSSEFLRLGLLTPQMIPPGRKRKLSGEFSDTEKRGSTWDVERLPRGRLMAHFEIMGDDGGNEYPGNVYADDLPGNHPLQMCHPRLWPFGDAAERRAYFDIQRGRVRCWIARHLGELDGYMTHTSAHGYSLAAADRTRLSALIDQFADELTRAFDGAGVISERAPDLRLVVDNKPSDARH